ncbi:MAG: YfaZ family outer membrane protein [Fluviicoccus sp.]|uniref:YfaZ family outer membrane protein n=1 Tax=Fluviicoccus sp. TaxID=2003552 RepID=UPI00271FAE38|nr:YfaZ family outer membrane protein [Fluviicoccus sp.]MDO8329564.1 YfaZ family outer membrane protein [Fluviicoccus sp.]
MNAKFLALAVLIAGPVFADSLSLDLNNDAVRLNYGHNFSKNYTSDFGWVHVKDLGNTYTAGINLDQKINEDLSATIGGKAVFQQHDRLEDGTAMAVGGGLSFTPPSAKQVSIAASLYFAPNVLSFGKMKNYQEFELRGEYEFSEQMTGYAGYRNNQADYDVAKNVDLYNGLMIGGKFMF